MAYIEAQIDLKGFSRVPAKEINDAAKAALSLVGNAWKARFLLEHFKNSANTRYPGVYKPRRGERGSGVKFKGSYTWSKLQKHGHTRPLELTGKSKELAKQSPVESMSSNRGQKAYVKIKLPAGFNRRAKGSEVRMRDEILAVNQQELTYLESLFVNELEKGLQDLLSGGRGRSVSASLAIQ